MNRRRQPDIPAVEEAQAQPDAGPPLAGILTQSWPLLVTSIIVIASSCTLARLIVVGGLFSDWHFGVLGLCYGTIAQLDYGTIDPTAAFMLSSISNSISMTTYGPQPEEVCHMSKYSPGNTTPSLFVIYAYLTAISTLDLIAIPVVQGTCWYRLFTTGCNGITFMCFSFCSLASVGLEVGSIYLASLKRNSAISGLSAMIFICVVALLFLNASVFLVQRRLGNDLRGVVRVPIPEIREAFDFVFRRAEKPPQPMTRRERPNMVTMYNENYG